MEKDSKRPSVKILSAVAAGGTATVRGTTENLGARKVEVIVNGDLDLRFVAENDADGAWECTFALPYNGEYAVEASIRDYSDFNAIRQVAPDENCFLLENGNVWGSTVTEHDGLYYMIFSMWDTHDAFSPDWYHYSELGYAVSTKRGGPYVYRGKALDATYANTTHKAPLKWDFHDGGVCTVDVFHNPTVLHSRKDGKYYLYFMGTSRDDMKKSHHRQRVGVAVADSPAGPWTISDAPVIDVRKDGFDSIFTANPSVTEVKRADGSYFYYAIYKGDGYVGDAHVTVSGIGVSDLPTGPFRRKKDPIMRDTEQGFSVEDCFVWYQNNTYYALAKDMTKGNWTGITYNYSYALFESADGKNWGLSAHRLAFENKIPWEGGTQYVDKLERAQLYTEDGIPFLITNATTYNGLSPYRGDLSCNVQIPLLGVPLATDGCTLTVRDGNERRVDKTDLQKAAKWAQTVSENAFSAEDRKKLQTARRAANVVLARGNAEQKDVDLVVAALRRLQKG